MKPITHHSKVGPRSSTATNRFFESLAEWAIRRRNPIFAFLAIVTVIFATGLPRVRVDNANELWFVQGDQTVERYKQFEEQFGSDKFIFFLLETENAFSSETLSQLETIGTAIESVSYKDQPAFSKVTHLGNVNYIQSSAGGIEVIGMGDGLGTTPEDLAELKRRAMETALYEGLLFSKDGKAVGLIAELARFPNDGLFHHHVTHELRAIVQQAPISEYNVLMAGGPILDTDMDTVSIEEAGLFGGLGLLLNMLVMMLLFRNKAGVAIPMALVGLTIIWTFGLIGFVGIPVNIVHVILPLMLISVGISDAVHILGEYQTEFKELQDRNKAIIHTMGQVGLACLLTTITTAIGMLSLSLAPIPPIRSLGLFAAIGVTAAFVITMLLVPAALSYTGLPERKKKAPTLPRLDFWTAGLLGLGNWTIRHAKAVVVATVVLLGVTIYGASLIEIETNFVHGFRESFPTRQAFTAIDSTLGGSSSLQMVLDTGVEGGVKDPEFLMKLDQLETWIKTEYGGIKQTLSVADLVKNLNKALNENDHEAYRIPSTRAAVAQELMLYENSDPDSLFSLVTDDFRVARLDARTVSGGTHAAAVLMDQVLVKAQEIFGPSVKIEYTGISHMFVRMAENLSTGQIRSYLAAFAMIFLMMVLVLKSPWLGTLSMIPNLLPVLCAMAVMGYAGVPMDFITLLVACIAIGIAVDDTIHFLVRYRQEFAKKRNYEDAIRMTLRSVGRAMLYTTLILCAGFSMFAASVMVNVAIFGGLLTLTLVVALLSDFVIMPAILVVFKPLGKPDLLSESPSQEAARNESNTTVFAD